MFIHEMTKDECDDALTRAKFGRLACAHDNQPYVLPMNIAFDGSAYLYGFARFGKKVEWMRANPNVCFEIDEVKSHNDWMSVIVFGRYEELPDKPEFAEARERAYSFIHKRAMWWEPAYISHAQRDDVDSLIPIFFRIHIDEMTGHRANSDGGEAAARGESRNKEKESEETASHFPKSTNILKAAFVYFAVVFGAGFVLGPIRVLFAVPRLGERMAELLELPLMIVVMVLAAKWIVRRFQLPPDAIIRLAVGFIALGLGLALEFTLVLTLRGLTLQEYFSTRDPVSEIAYYLTLILFGLMPLLANFQRRQV